jgi:UDP-glucose:(heptosyl)LPS alpha-1,3-glucosyltransferase
VKIALVILHADVARGGAERYTIDLAASLVARGHGVAVLASSFQSGAMAGERVLLKADGVTRTGRYAHFLDSLDAHLRVAKYDVVHAMLPVRQCDIYHPHAGLAAEAISEGHRAKAGSAAQTLAWMGNRFNARRRRFARVERELLNSKNPPVVLCLSQLIQSVVKRHYPNLAADRLVSLFNGIDLDRYQPQHGCENRELIRGRYQFSDSDVVGLMLAHDFERKGLGQAIAALAETKRAATGGELKLLVGGKPDPGAYRQLARSLGVESRVIFAGPVREPAGFYQAADFFVLPTRFDPCSLVVLESLAMGLPVISTAQNGACEVMTSGEHGFVLPNPDDLTGLVKAMEAMAQQELRKKMALKCLELRPTLSQQTHLDTLETIYQAHNQITAPHLGV